MLLILVLLVLLVELAPAWPYSRGWGYRPSGLMGAILLVVVALNLLGTLHM
jgi:hypothetical protein